jgi:hypothetical protein
MPFQILVSPGGHVRPLHRGLSFRLDTASNDDVISGSKSGGQLDGKTLFGEGQFARQSRAQS